MIRKQTRLALASSIRPGERHRLPLSGRHAPDKRHHGRKQHLSRSAWVDWHLRLHNFPSTSAEIPHHRRLLRKVPHHRQRPREVQCLCQCREAEHPQRRRILSLAVALAEPSSAREKQKLHQETIPWRSRRHSCFQTFRPPGGQRLSVRRPYRTDPGCYQCLQTPEPPGRPYRRPSGRPRRAREKQTPWSESSTSTSSHNRRASTSGSLPAAIAGQRQPSGIPCLQEKHLLDVSSQTAP